jgi:uncharacterized protein YhaN
LNERATVGKKKLQVFVSSTYSDLREERQAAVEAILKAGHIPAGMELFAAGNESQLQTIRRWIDESDAYMLILGGRYGSVDKATGTSYTELEYDYAVSQDKPVFAVVITEPALEAKVKKEGTSAIEGEQPQKLKALREKVLSRISSFFADAKDIKLAVHETLSDFLVRYDFKGWVSGDEVEEVGTLLQELNALRKEKAELEKELSALKKKAGTSKSGTFSDSELDEVLTLLSSNVVESNVFNEKGDEAPRRFSVLRILSLKRDDLVTGVSSYSGPVDRFLFSTIAPKLAVHGVAAVETSGSGRFRTQRYRLTPKGLALLAYIDKKGMKKKDSEVS